MKQLTLILIAISLLGNLCNAEESVKTSSGKTIEMRQLVRPEISNARNAWLNTTPGSTSEKIALVGWIMECKTISEIKEVWINTTPKSEEEKNAVEKWFKMCGTFLEIKEFWEKTNQTGKSYEGRILLMKVIKLAQTREEVEWAMSLVPDGSEEEKLAKIKLQKVSEY